MNELKDFFISKRRVKLRKKFYKLKYSKKVTNIMRKMKSRLI